MIRNYYYLFLIQMEERVPTRTRVPSDMESCVANMEKLDTTLR